MLQLQELLFLTTDLTVLSLISDKYSERERNKNSSSAPFSRHHVGLIMQHLSPALPFTLVITEEKIGSCFNFLSHYKSLSKSYKHKKNMTIDHLLLSAVLAVSARV